MKNEENWINQILAAADQIDQQKPSPFLFQKIISRINEQEQYVLNKNISLKWSVAFILLFGLNVAVLYASTNKHKNNHQSKSTIEINNQTIYSY